MNDRAMTPCVAFEGSREIASGALIEVASTTKQLIDAGSQNPILIFDDATSLPIEVDFRGTLEDVRDRLRNEADENAQAAETARRPGRPKLGVVAREVTLLPRHWDWLNAQSGGASVALRKLVEEARRLNEEKDRIRKAQEAAYRFMSAMAGDYPNFEEAARALFSGEAARFSNLIGAWPVDVRSRASKLANAAFEDMSHLPRGCAER